MGVKGLRKSGMVAEALPATLFKVLLDDGAYILAHLSGKMRVNFIRIMPGDRVVVEMPDENSARGRIVYRE